MTVSCPDRAKVTLGERLRLQTRGAHLAAEAAFDLPARLASIGRYREALVVLAAFHRACEPALTVGAGRLPMPLRDGPERRRARLGADLETLGRPDDAPGALQAAPTDDEDWALGVWYVHEGAALGGLLIAAEIRRRLPVAIPAATFFAGEGQATAARWRAFQGVLVECDERDGAGERVLAGARATFALLTAALLDRSP